MGQTGTFVAPATLDLMILAGLRDHGEEVPSGEIARVCGLDPDREVLDRQRALARLVGRGLITRRTVRTLDRKRPLFDWIETVVYQAIQGGTDAPQ